MTAHRFSMNAGVVVFARSPNSGSRVRNQASVAYQGQAHCPEISIASGAPRRRTRREARKRGRGWYGAPEE